MPARLAASIFSFTPPIGNTLPRRVISPVMANLARTLRWVNTEANEVSMVIPAEGPSLGTAPAGTCICKSHWSNTRGSICKYSACDFKNVSAVIADSFITSPNEPVRVSFPVPLVRELSINKISPPTLVQAKPVTTPATSLFW